MDEYGRIASLPGIHYAEKHSLELKISLEGQALERVQEQLQEGFIAFLQRPLPSSRSSKFSSSLTKVKGS